jgi:hypothetical protein
VDSEEEEQYVAANRIFYAKPVVPLMIQILSKSHAHNRLEPKITKLSESNRSKALQMKLWNVLLPCYNTLCKKTYVNIVLDLFLSLHEICTIQTERTAPGTCRHNVVAQVCAGGCTSVRPAARPIEHINYLIIPVCIVCDKSPRT